jgi:hypothetical protein
VADAPEHKIEDEIRLQLAVLVAAEQRARRRARIIGIVVASLAAAAFAALIFYDPDAGAPEPGPTQGELRLVDSPLGSARIGFDAGGCVSGQREGFRGVIVTSGDGGARLRIREDQLAGSRLRLQLGERALVLEERDCRRFDLELADRPGRGARGVGYRGALELDCRAGQGSASGSIHFDRCLN